MKKNLLINSMILLIALVGMNSCEDPAPPKGDFTYEVDGFEVSFTTEVSEVTSYSWDFGDNSVSTDPNPVHVYTTSGTYTVTLTIKGEGGSKILTQEVEILPSFEEMLTGGPGDANGKTWILSPTPNSNFDGVTDVSNTWPILGAVPDDFMGWLRRETDNEFTFKHDGTYSINPVNDSILSMSIYCFLNKIGNDGNGPYGTCRAAFTPPASATWTLHDEDFTVDAITNPADVATPPGHANVTISGKKWLSFSPGAYFGILDWITPSHMIVKSITPTEMHVVLMMCIYQGVFNEGGVAFANLPTHMFHLTYIPKP